MVKFLTAAGLMATKPRQTKWYDVGDIWLADDVVLQAKAWRNLTGALSAGTSGAKLQATRAKRRFGFAVIKRPGKGAGEAYVVMPLATFVEFEKSRVRPD